MSLVKFRYSPESASYAVEDPAEVVLVKLDGGAGRYRRDKLNSSSHVTVRWLFGREEYRYFRAFYRSLLGRGSDPFLIDLIIDYAEMTEYTAHFVPGSVHLSEQMGFSYIVTAQLEVTSLLVDDDTEVYYVYMINEFGEGWQSNEDDLNTIVNSDLPAAL